MTPPAAAAAIPATRPAPARRGALPGRVATPVPPARTRPGRPRRGAAPSRGAAPLRTPARAAQAAAALAPSRLFDRAIRSRSWIGLVAFALIGIVAMQLWLLKLNGGIGRAIEHEELLQRTNAALSAENSSIAAGDLIEQQAITSGMRFLAPGSLIFLRTRGPSDERLAAARMAQPVQAPTQGESTSTAPSAEPAASSGASSSTAEPVASSGASSSTAEPAASSGASSSTAEPTARTTESGG